jgi:hypothetical protein
VEKRTDNREFPLPLLMGGLLLAVLAAVVIQLAGITLSGSLLLENAGLDQCEALSAAVGNSTPVSRQFRSGRYRNSSSGRINSSRFGGGVGDIPEDGFVSALVDMYADHSGDCFFESDDFWIKFIISALPVRAGPAA